MNTSNSQVDYLAVHFADRLRASWKYHRESPQCRDWLRRFAVAWRAP